MLPSEYISETVLQRNSCVMEEIINFIVTTFIYERPGKGHLYSLSCRFVFAFVNDFKRRFILDIWELMELFNCLRNIRGNETCTVPKGFQNRRILSVLWNVWTLPLIWLEKQASGFDVGRVRHSSTRTCILLIMVWTYTLQNKVCWWCLDGNESHFVVPTGRK